MKLSINPIEFESDDLAEISKELIADPKEVRPDSKNADILVTPDELLPTFLIV